MITKDTIEKTLVNEYIENAKMSLRFLITKSCNSNCLYCFEEGTPNSNNNIKTTLKTSDFKNILKVFCDMGGKTFSISGGEPSLFMDEVYDLFSIAEKYDINYFITSNGTNSLLYDLALRFPKLKIGISLDTFDKEEYKYLRGIDKLDQVSELISKIGKLPNVLNINRVVTSLENEKNKLSSVIDNISNLNIDFSSTYLRLIPAYSSKNNDSLSVDNYLKYLQSHFEEFSPNLMNINQQVIYSAKIKNVNIIVRTKGIFSPKCCIENSKCEEGIGYIRINPNGNIQPCYGRTMQEKFLPEDSFIAIETKILNTWKLLDSLKI
jgi:molybdenum cofactor biosynthesis enzyme MoaA